jgi:tetraprenyl-beta-curcumene synthase
VFGPISSRRSGASRRAFVCAAVRYWTGVFPLACREIRECERAANIIPDAQLRKIALVALSQERGNLEGAAAFAAFAPRHHRLAVARAAIAFQALYDFADAVAEQPDSSDKSNTRMLHTALLVALDPGMAPLDYYAHSQPKEGTYLVRLVERCRTALRQLPSLALVADQMQRAADRIRTYQCLNHQGPTDSYDGFARWAHSQAAPESNLWWWETGAAAGSSLAIFALIAAAAEPALRAGHADAVERAYFPWIGALHTLLDSLVDEDEDAITGQHCLTARYGSRTQAAERLQRLTVRAVEHAKALPNAEDHMMILAAMIGFYLANPQAQSVHVRSTADRVLEACGEHALPALLVLRSRHMARQIGRPHMRMNTSEG